jgi:hypothetical protein
MKAIPGQISKNQKAMRGRMGAPLSPTIARASPMDEAMIMAGHPNKRIISFSFNSRSPA